MERRRSLHCGEHVVETYASLSGPTPLPPLWSLGFRQSRYSYYPESRVIEIADRLHADRRAQTAARDLEQRDAKQPNKPLLITPKLAELPVYVREGSILPIAPLTQSTGETPVGPLTLRVYAGGNCHGDLYQDDGKSFAFRSGQFLRLHFSCEVKPDGTPLSISLLVRVPSLHGGSRCGSRLSAGHRERGGPRLPPATTCWNSQAVPGPQLFQSHPLLRTSLSTSSAARTGNPDAKCDSYRLRVALPQKRRQYYPFVSFRV